MDIVRRIVTSFDTAEDEGDGIGNEMEEEKGEEVLAPRTSPTVRKIGATVKR